MKLEICSGERPTPGYLTTDITAKPGLDYVAPAWELDLPDGSLTEVIALGTIEHLTYTQAAATFRNVHRMLAPGGEFLFDVPDIDVWCRYLAHPDESPFPREHVLSTLYGWQRWDGDEHKSGWDQGMVHAYLTATGFTETHFGLDEIRGRVPERRRFSRPADAHIFVRAVA